MRRIVWTTMAVCGFLATCAEDVGVTFDANGDVTVAAGGALYLDVLANGMVILFR